MIFKKMPPEEKVNFSIDSLYKGHLKVTYNGVKAIRCPFDYVIYQMILFEVKPDLIIEIGTNKGGGALYMADILNVIGKGVIHTIDIVSIAEPIVAKHPRIKLFTEGFENYPLELARDFETVLVIEDASHMYADTLAAIKKFAPLVTLGSYLIVEDGIVNALGMERDYKGGPLKALREILPKHSEFMVDRRWCDMFGTNATFNVNGYLRKIK
jgi:cephalosporin hydroxylase